MKAKMYAVKDELTGSFFSPVIMKSDAEALRIFKSQVNHQDVWKDNPSDFSLYSVGTYDDETGEVKGELEKIAGGRSVVE